MHTVRALSCLVVLRFPYPFYPYHLGLFQRQWKSYGWNDASEATLENISISYELPQADHDDVIKWKHFPRYWPFVQGIFYRSPVNSPHKGRWRGALMFSLIHAWTNDWANNYGDVSDLRCRRAHYDVTVMWYDQIEIKPNTKVSNYVGLDYNMTISGFILNLITSAQICQYQHLRLSI